ncbi:MAG: CDP-alcohol phosphatidyltransferase family protein [Candidatus Altiarchaeota archaeon]|nr:CDP-alcohol phosphatidyltransferase family protein [Candidatus Altiarchaeota archaeon]
MLSKLRPRTDPVFQKFWSPLGRWFTPNQLTVFGLVLAIVAGYEIFVGRYWLAAFLVLSSALMDSIDGALSRGRNMATPFGAILDAVFDRLGEGAIYIALATVDFLAVPAMVFSYAISHVGIKAPKGIDGGFAERTERAFIITGFLLLNQIHNGLIILNILLVITLFQRMYSAKKLVEKRR